MPGKVLGIAKAITCRPSGIHTLRRATSSGADSRKTCRHRGRSHDRHWCSSADRLMTDRWYWWPMEHPRTPIYFTRKSLRFTQKTNPGITVPVFPSRQNSIRRRPSICRITTSGLGRRPRDPASRQSWESCIPVLSSACTRLQTACRRASLESLREQKNSAADSGSTCVLKLLR